MTRQIIETYLPLSRNNKCGTLPSIFCPQSSFWSNQNRFKCRSKNDTRQGKVCKRFPHIFEGGKWIDSIVTVLGLKETRVAFQDMRREEAGRERQRKPDLQFRHSRNKMAESRKKKVGPNLASPM